MKEITCMLSFFGSIYRKVSKSTSLKRAVEEPKDPSANVFTPPIRRFSLNFWPSFDKS